MLLLYPASIPELKVGSEPTIETITADMLRTVWNDHSLFNTNTCTTSTSHVKIYIKSSKKLLHVSVFDHLQGAAMSSLKSLLLLITVGYFYAKSGDVAACL